MNKSGSKPLQVGILVFSSLVIFVLLIYFIGSKENLFSKKTEIVTSFQDVRGVVVGNNVRYSGITVGKVTDIRITSDSTVAVFMSIANQYARFIYKDAVAEISQDGLVGNKIINITSGTDKTGAIEHGTLLRGREGVDVENMLYNAQSLLFQAKDVIETIKSISDKIDQGEGDISKLLNEQQMSKQIEHLTSDLTVALEKVNKIATQIESGDGDIGKLIYSSEWSDKGLDVLNNITEIGERAGIVLSDLEKTAESINTGEGAVSLLLNSKSTANSIDSTINQLQKSLQEFDKTAQAVRESWFLRVFSGKKRKAEQEY